MFTQKRADRRTSWKRPFLSRAFKNGKYSEMQKPEAGLFRWLNRTEFTVTQKFEVPSTNPAAMSSVKVILSSHRVGARRLSPGNERAGVFYIVTSKYFARTMHSFGRKWHFTPHDITETGFLCARLFLQEKITSYKQVYKT